MRASVPGWFGRAGGDTVRVLTRVGFSIQNEQPHPGNHADQGDEKREQFKEEHGRTNQFNAAAVTGITAWLLGLSQFDEVSSV